MSGPCNACVTATMPTSFTFRCLIQQQVTWTLTDAMCNPVTGATVTATLYANRSISNAAQFPGTIADPNLANLTLAETVPGVSGIYVGIVPQAFNPPDTNSGFGFVTIITAMSGATVLDVWSIPTVVVTPQNLNNIVQMDDVKTWLQIALNNTDSDGLLQILINGVSAYITNRTGIASFTQVNIYNEIYNGNGAQRMFLKNYPIVSITSIQIGAYQVPKSTGLLNPGWFIEQDAKSVALRYAGGAYSMAPYSIFPQGFWRGIGNVQVIYKAGYTSVPYDLYECAMKICAINYKRQDWIDLASKSLGVSGSSGHTSYRSWARPPECEEVLKHYQRRALV
jgi:gp6-like head-tail connector protein